MAEWSKALDLKAEGEGSMAWASSLFLQIIPVNITRNPLYVLQGNPCLCYRQSSLNKSNAQISVRQILVQNLPNNLNLIGGI